MQFAARQSRLEQVRGIHRPVGLAGADQCVHLVDEQNDPSVGRCYFRENRFQPFLKFAAVFGACNQSAHVECQQLLVLEAFRHVAIDDAQCKAFGNCRLADARFADQHRIVLGPARQHLDGAADFLVAPDDGIELALACCLGQVARIFFQRIIGLLRRLRNRQYAPFGYR